MQLNRIYFKFILNFLSCEKSQTIILVLFYNKIHGLKLKFIN